MILALSGEAINTIPACGDIDLDGRDEIIVRIGDEVRAFRQGGAEIKNDGLPFKIGRSSSSALAIADICGDNRPEIITTSDERRIVVIGKNNSTAPWEVAGHYEADVRIKGIAAGDIFDNGRNAIAYSTYNHFANDGSPVSSQVGVLTFDDKAKALNRKWITNV